MREGLRGTTRACLGALAFVGVIAGHALGFYLAEPHAGARAALLETTGHGYWPFMVALGLAALVTCLAHTALAEAHGGHDRKPGKARVALRLASLQIPAFVLLEAAERFFAHHDLHELVVQPVFVAGLLAQVLVAVVSTLVLTLFVRTVRAILRRAKRPTSRPARLAGRFERTHFFFSQLIGSGRTLRGPPSRLVA